MYIVVLNYETAETVIKEVPHKLEELDGDDILTNMGFSSSNTEYMIVSDDLHIRIDTKDTTVNTTLMKKV